MPINSEKIKCWVGIDIVNTLSAGLVTGISLFIFVISKDMASLSNHKATISEE